MWAWRCLFWSWTRCACSWNWSRALWSRAGGSHIRARSGRCRGLRTRSLRWWSCCFGVWHRGRCVWPGWWCGSLRVGRLRWRRTGLWRLRWSCCGRLRSRSWGLRSCRGHRRCRRLWGTCRCAWCRCCRRGRCRRRCRFLSAVVQRSEGCSLHEPAGIVVLVAVKGRAVEVCSGIVPFKVPRSAPSTWSFRGPTADGRQDAPPGAAGDHSTLGVFERHAATVRERRQIRAAVGNSDVALARTGGA